jgi:hypothetical protein
MSAPHETPVAQGAKDATGQMTRYWLTPPPVFDALNAEFAFDFDPCPCPRPDGYDSLLVPWGNSNFVNPPFRKHDGVDGKGPTAFVRKAIAEQALGKSSVLILPVQSYVNLLLEAGAELRSLGRLRWIEATTGEPCQSPSPICCFVLRGKAPSPNPSGNDKKEQPLISKEEN